MSSSGLIFQSFHTSGPLKKVITLEFNNDMTLGEVKEIMMELVLTGHKCPCCTRMAKVYKRTIYKGMVTSLITLHHNSKNGGFLHWGRIKEFDGPLALIYDGEFLGLDNTETITVYDAMGEDFDLIALMNEVVTL